MYESLAPLARDTIARKNPFPNLEGLPSNLYGAHWGLTDLYPQDEAILRRAVENKETFDTGWIGCKKEIRWFRIISNGDIATIMANEEMDVIDDLVYDVCPKDKELTEEQAEAVKEWFFEDGLSTESTIERTVKLTTYEDVMKVISELEDENYKILDHVADIVKNMVEYAIEFI